MDIKDYEQTELDVKRLVEDKEVFAALFNYHLRDIGCHIEPEGLMRLDTTFIETAYTGKNKTDGMGGYSWLKYLTAMQAGGTVYLLVFLTDCSEICTFMPVVAFGYAVGQYNRMLSRKENSPGFDREDPESYKGILKPVIPLAVYFSTQKWEGAESLQDMFAGRGSENGGQYSVTMDTPVLFPASISDGDIDQFPQELRAVMSALKYAGKGGEPEVGENFPDLSGASDTAKRVINGITGSEIPVGDQRDSWAV